METTKYIVQYAFIGSTQMNDAYISDDKTHAETYAAINSWHSSIGRIRVIKRVETVENERTL